MINRPQLLLRQTGRIVYNFCKGTIRQGEIQDEHVYKVYDKIAEHFSQTRYKPWPRVAHFLQHLKKGSVVLDIGCGNGRNMRVNPAVQVIGIDRCHPLLNIAAQRGQNPQLLHADALKLPIRSQSCDAFICIALLHHFSSLEMRKNAIKEFSRVLKKNGQGLIYVRSLQVYNNNNQLVRELPQQDFFVPWHLQTKYEKNLQEAIQNGYEYKPQKNSVIYQRFYHAFVKDELEDLISSCQVLTVKKSFYDKSNWACITEKI